MYLSYRSGKKDFNVHVQSASVPLALLGVCLLVSGLWGQFAWTLPGSYNILFYDPLVSFGIVMLSFSLSARFGVRLDYSGVLGLLFGVMAIIYGFQGYNVGLTNEPIVLLGMYFLYGIAGVLSYPVSLMSVRTPGARKDVWKGWYVVLALFFLALLAGSLLAGYLGYSAVSAHLLSAP